MLGLGGGTGGVREPVPLVRSVTERLRGGAATSTQDNDFRRSAIFARRDRQFPPVLGDNPDRPANDQGPVPPRRDPDLPHGRQYSRLDPGPKIRKTHV